jgi:hypothetical protein
LRFSTFLISAWFKAGLHLGEVGAADKARTP